MAQEKSVLGYIDCPSCGTAGGMRITHDKNGDPFGFCEAECNQQLRIGGSARRVALFVKSHPWAGSGAVSVPVPEKTAPPPDVAPVPVPEKQKRGGFAFGL